MTHYTGEQAQFGPPLSISTIAEICRQDPDRERRRWAVYKNQIVGIGSPTSEFFSWRGFVIRSTGDYDIYKPMLLQSTGHLIELRAPGAYNDLVHCGALTEDVVATWHGFRSFQDEESAKLKLLPGMRDRDRVRTVSVDGIPWELHMIADSAARCIATASYLKECV